MARELRKDVRLPGLPYKWQTNLTNDEAREVYAALALDLARAQGAITAEGGAIRIRSFQRWIDFLDGGCLCYGVEDNVWVIYHTRAEWEVLEARAAERDELRAEIESKLKVDQLLFESDDDRLATAMKTAHRAGQYEEAAQFFLQRMALRDANAHLRNRVGSLEWDILFVGIDILASLLDPSKAIALVQKSQVGGHCFVHLAERYRTNHSIASNASQRFIESIFKAGLKHKDGTRMYEYAALFWRRNGNYERALAWCDRALEMGIQDKTKGGFRSRRERIQKEFARRTAQHRSPLDQA